MIRVFNYIFILYLAFNTVVPCFMFAEDCCEKLNIELDCTLSIPGSTDDTCTECCPPLVKCSSCYSFSLIPNKFFSHITQTENNIPVVNNVINYQTYFPPQLQPPKVS